VTTRASGFEKITKSGWIAIIKLAGSSELFIRDNTVIAAFIG
jgi:hypothetical protein